MVGPVLDIRFGRGDRGFCHNDHFGLHCLRSLVGGPPFPGQRHPTWYPVVVPWGLMVPSLRRMMSSFLEVTQADQMGNELRIWSGMVTCSPSWKAGGNPS